MSSSIYKQDDAFDKIFSWPLEQLEIDLETSNYLLFSGGNFAVKNVKLSGVNDGELALVYCSTY